MSFSLINVKQVGRKKENKTQENHEKLWWRGSRGTVRGQVGISVLVQTLVTWAVWPRAEAPYWSCLGCVIQGFQWPRLPRTYGPRFTSTSLAQVSGCSTQPLPQF